MPDRSACPYCQSTAHPPSGCSRRPRSGKRKPRRLIAFDCETTASAGIVLFLASDAERRADSIYSQTGLEFEQVCDWLIGTGSGALCFGFYFDYDCNQIIAFLPPLHQAQLAARGSVSFRGYRLRHTPGKRFSIAHNGRSVTVWDCAGWAQTSFAKLCDQWELGTESERAQIRAMKARRGEFDSATRDELISYTTLECSLLCVWVARVLALHEQSSIKLKAYSGPGATASALLRSRDWTPPEVPEQVLKVAELAYFGGRSETSTIGPVPGPVYGYDLNSAYPAAIAELPELAGARWFRARRYVAGAWGFYRVRWKQPPRSVWGLFPVRGAMLPGGRRSVSLLYPIEGEGWFHSWEVEAAIAGAPGAVEVRDALLVEPRGEPFAWVRELAALRLEYKRAGDMRAFPLKVGLNSLYGKMAQRVGKAPLQCFPYAAAITGRTRAALLSLALRYQERVLLMATDGILLTEPADVSLSPALGDWELETYPDAWILQSGVYWAGAKQRTRGIDARGLELSDVEARWSRAGTRARIVLATRRVMSYRLASAWNRPEQTGRWYESERAVRFNPEPRRRRWKYDGARLLTLPAHVADYEAQALMDALAIASDPAAFCDELEAMPDWSLPDV